MSRYGLKAAVGAVAATIMAIVLAAPAGAAISRSTFSGRLAAGTAAPGTAWPQPGVPSGLARQVLLITGDRVMSPAGGGTGPGMIAPQTSSGLAGPVMALSIAGAGYDLPLAALPYLGHGLDPRLFEPRALLAHERRGRLPVRISYHGHRPTLPGITITRAGSGAATGYLTPTSARRFGAALNRQYAADHARASYGTDGIFAGGTTIALPGAPALTAAARPDYPMHTLTVKATDLAGQPDTGDSVLLINVDNTNLAASVPPTQVFYHGEARYSVPAGRYFALGVFFRPEGTGGLSRFVVLPQFTVTGSTAVAMPETAADSKITVATPRPAASGSTSFSVLRTGASGPALWAEFIRIGGSLWINPTHAKPTVGTMRVFAGQQLESPHGRSMPYEYTFAHTDSSGLVPVPHYVMHPKDLATINERFYQAVKLAGSWAFYGILPGTSLNDPTAWFGNVGGTSVPLTIPGRLTEYAEYTGGTNAARMEWHPQFEPSGTTAAWGGDVRLLHPGEHLTDNWDAYPLHPGANVLLYSEPSVFYAPLPSALRAGNTLRLDLDPFDDSQPGHSIGLLRWPTAPKITGSYQIDQNGTKIAGGSAVPSEGLYREFYTQATVSPRPSTIRFSLHLAHAGAGFPLSTATSTVWTWRSASAAGAKLPPGWTCLPNTTSTSSDRSCTSEPMMTLGYAVAGLGLDGAAPAGQQTVHLSVGHLQLATASAITAVSVSVSFDGGKTWHPARVAGQGGRYKAAFTAPAGAKVTLRTSAGDAASGSVTETITSAYQIAS